MVIDHDGLAISQPRFSSQRLIVYFVRELLGGLLLREVSGLLCLIVVTRQGSSELAFARTPP